VREEGVTLKNGIHMAMFRWNVGNILIIQLDMTDIDALKTGYQAQNRSFTAAGRAEQRKKFAVINGEIEIGDYRFAIKAFAKTGQLNQR